MRLFFYDVTSIDDLIIQTQKYYIPQTERVMHVHIVKAIINRDIVKAEEAVRLHLRYWAECKEEMKPAFYKIILPSLVNLPVPLNKSRRPGLYENVWALSDTNL